MSVFISFIISAVCVVDLVTFDSNKYLTAEGARISSKKSEMGSTQQTSNTFSSLV